MQLFIAQILIDCEPGYIIGVFDNKEKAIKAALTSIDNIPAVTEVRLNEVYEFDGLYEELLDRNKCC